MSLIWPLSILHANKSCCGGGSKNVDVGGNIQPFEVPAVHEIVPVDGFTLKVNRVKWSIQTAPEESILASSQQQALAAVFKDKSTTIRAFRLRSLPPSSTLRDLASAAVQDPFLSSHVRIENIRTTFAIRGVKASYWGKSNLLSQNVQLVRYYFQEKSGRILCFEVTTKRNFANWADANYLILNTLQRRTSV